MKKWLSLLFLFLVSCEDTSKMSPEFRDISVQEAASLISRTPTVVVLDIRTPREFRQGHIADAENIDFLSPGFEKALQEFDKDKTYLVHCASGGRSTKALRVFRDLDFQKVYHLKEGMNGWVAAGQPVDR